MAERPPIAYLSVQVLHVSPTVLTRVHSLHLCSVRSNVLQSDWCLEIPSQGQTGCAQFPRPSLALQRGGSTGSKDYN